MRTSFVAALVALSLSACGKKGVLPTAPDSGSGSYTSYTLTIRAARSPKGKIAGATVVTDDSRSFATDSSGVVPLSASDVGRTVYITANGYTGPSIIIFRPIGQGMTHYLLPDDAMMPYAWIRTAFYGDSDAQWLWRPMPGRLDVELSGEGWADHRISEALAWGSRITNSAQHHVIFNVVPAGQTGTVKMYADSNDPIFSAPGYENAWAVTFLTVRGPVVVGARIVWKVFLDDANSAMPEHIGKAMAHELGHVTGIEGHPCCGIMGSADPLLDFSQQEKDAFDYLFLRPPGTRPPDNLAAAPQMAASSGGRRQEVVVCVLHR